MKRERLYPVNVRVELETVQELRREAKLRKVSPSALIRQLLRASLPLLAGLRAAGPGSPGRQSDPPPRRPGPGRP
ncbi:MAG: ribbon-helix-helix protein, CopG family [bacterium]